MRFAVDGAAGGLSWCVSRATLADSSRSVRLVRRARLVRLALRLVRRARLALRLALRLVRLACVSRVRSQGWRISADPLLASVSDSMNTMSQPEWTHAVPKPITVT